MKHLRSLTPSTRMDGCRKVLGACRGIDRWACVFAFICTSLICAPTDAQVCATPQKDGNVTTPAAISVVNGYFTPNNGTYAAGSSPTITLSGARGVATWAAGDMALLIQMQCVDLNRSDSDSYGDGVAGRPAQGYLETAAADCKAGRYEYVKVGAGSSATSLVLGANLQFTYVQANPTASQTRRSFQVIRVPQYANFTLGGAVQSLAWNGLNGGVVALDVAKTMDFGGKTVTVAAQGFRGGGSRMTLNDSNNPVRSREVAGAVANASKGEGIAGTPRYIFVDNTPFDAANATGTLTNFTGTAYIGYPGTGTTADFDFARGAPGNAGGGGQYLNGIYHNGGGGGGGNGGAGGRGAFGWRSGGWGTVVADYSNVEAVTGQHLAAFGGGSFGAAGLSRVVMGGGGGAGDINGAASSVASGATGGGVVMIRAGALTGAGVIDLRGGSANEQTNNEAAGAGAAGGSAIIISPNWTAGILAVNAQGGRGGDSWLSGTSAHSGGGGGGGGVVVRSGALSVDVSPGSNGITNINDSPPGGRDHGALPGQDGVNQLVDEATSTPPNVGYRCLAIVNLSLTKTAAPAVAVVGQTVSYTLLVANSGPSQATNASVVDAMPAGMGTLTFVSAAGSSPATTLTNSSIASNNTFTGTVTVPVGQTITLVLQAVAGANGAPLNTAMVTEPANASDPVLADNTGAATVVVGPSVDVSASKAVTPSFIAVGKTATFTLTFVNAGPDSAVGARITDTFPRNFGTVTFISASGQTGGTLTSSSIAGTVFTGTATLPAGSTLTVVLRATAGTATSVVNTVSIAAPANVTDVRPANNSATAAIGVGNSVDLSISKVATPTVVLYEKTTTFTVTVVNLGPNAVTGATVYDKLPSGLSGLTMRGQTSSPAGATVTARVVTSSELRATVTMPANSTIVFVFSAVAGAYGDQVNRVTVTVPNGSVDPMPANNTAQATVSVPLSTELTLSKTNGVTSLVAGQTTAYVITVDNNGPNAGNGTVLTDPASKGLVCTSVSCTASGGAICPVSPSMTQLQGSGINLAVFPANSQFMFTVVCGVTATGL